MNEEHERIIMGIITDLLDLSWVQKAKTRGHVPSSGVRVRHPIDVV